MPFGAAAAAPLICGGGASLAKRLDDARAAARPVSASLGAA